MSIATDVASRTGSRDPGRWYVTTAYVSQTFVEGELVTRPSAVVHAKEMGTATTACGLWSYSWRKMLDLPFPLPVGAAPGAKSCPACLAKVIEEW
ncbi:hypothetical protein ASE01_13710 [Nocardioides sp. Root190]|uniref:hypothetical protein n=1 Tax=Nocardioides sp. Root190 TaxID=1736488 RepID=UPI0006F549FA|nr:hypothetical protein [Nocardioides sp. Root190]KRB76083.1 hypothetical protein ASE01_13710 [Nocardioides sp. Root190]